MTNGLIKKQEEARCERSFGPRTMPFSPIFVKVSRTSPQLTERQEEASVLGVREPATCGHGQKFCLNRLHWIYSYRETDFSSYQATLSSRSINHACEGNYNKCNNMNNITVTCNMPNKTWITCRQAQGVNNK